MAFKPPQFYFYAFYVSYSLSIKLYYCFSNKVFHFYFIHSQCRDSGYYSNKNIVSIAKLYYHETPMLIDILDGKTVILKELNF